MTPLSLLDWRPSPRAEQERHLSRVSGRIAGAILAFCRERVGAEFYASELHAAVGGAPASADRVLRMLRKEGRVAYVVVDRGRSLYRVEACP